MNKKQFVLSNGLKGLIEDAQLILGKIEKETLPTYDELSTFQVNYEVSLKILKELRQVHDPHGES